MTAQLPSRERLAEIHKLAAKSDKYIYHLRADEVEAMSRALLAAHEQKPIGAFHISGGTVEATTDYCKDGEWPVQDGIVEVYAHPAPVPAVSDEMEALRRDANRYRFLRDRDAFGADNEPGLVTWDEIAELELNEFDSAIDARMNHPNVEWVPPSGCVGDSLAELYAELYRLRAEIKGPDGFATWKDAAIAERMSKKQPKNIPGEIDYLHAMSVFHSDKWHKMDPITGYMHGWNNYHAAMLNGGKS